MDSQQKNPAGPMSLKKALEDHADLVYNGGKVDVEALASLEFTDTTLDPPEAFRLLRDYEKLPRGQRLILDKLIICGGIPVSNRDIWDAHSFHTILSYSELVTKFEHFIREADVSTTCNLALAMRFSDSSERSLRAICSIIKRNVHYRHEKDRNPFGKRSKISKEEKLSIQPVQDFLEQNEGNSQLLALYEREYEDVEYQPTTEDAKTRVIIKPEELNITKVEKLLNCSPDEYDYTQVFNWLFNRAIGNETFSESIRKNNYFRRTIDNLRGPSDFFESSQLLDPNDDRLKGTLGISAEASNLYNEIVARVLAALKKSSHSPDAALQFTSFFCGLGIDNTSNTLLDEMKKIIAKSLESLAPGKIIEGLEKLDIGQILLAMSSISEVAAHRLLEYLSSENFLHTQPAPRIIAAFFERNKDLWLFDRYRLLLSADHPGLRAPERRRLKNVIKEALALAGMKNQIVILEFQVEAAIARIEKADAERIRPTTSGIRARIARVGAEEKDEESAIESDPANKSGRKNGPTTEPPPKRPSQLDAAEFSAAIKAKFDALNLDPTLAANIGVSKTANGPIPSKIRADLEQTAAAAIELLAWNDGEEKVISVEPNSILARLGIKAVRFRKTQSFDVEFLLKEEQAGDEPVPFYAGIHLNDQGAPASENFRAEPLLKAILELEAIRHFLRIMEEGDEVKDAGNLDVLRLLGLEAMPAPEPDPQPDEPRNPHPNNPPNNPEPQDETPNFILENWQAFEEFMEHLQKTCDIKQPFKDLHETVSRLATEIQVDKAIPNFGVTVEMPAGHVLSPHVQSMDFYDPGNTREIFRKLEIDPSIIHVDNLDKADAYLVRINVRTAGVDEQITACVIPPTNDIYFFGVDPNEIIDNERAEPMALTHMILRAFKMAVMRDDDPEFTQAKGHAAGSKRRGVTHLNRIITEATNTSYPPIVTSWKTPNGNTPPTGRKSGNPKSGNLEEYVREIFEKIAVEDAIETGLVSAGIRMRASELWRLLPNSPEILRHKFPHIYMPVDNPAILAELLKIYREQKFVSTPEAEDWLLEILQREGTSEADAFAALDHATKNPQAVKWAVNPRFQVICRRKFATNSLSSDPAANPYEQLLRQTLAICRQDSGIGPQTSLAEVYRALRGVSVLNPEDVKIASSGASDYRFPYRFRDGGREIPVDGLFKNGHEIQSNIDLEVVKVIAGNRARMSGVSEMWLRGDNRGEDINFASKIQSRLSDRRPEVDLRPRARALLVWEFLNNDDDLQYAFSFLDTARDSINPDNPESVIPAATRLQRFPKIQTAATKVLMENTTGTHTDFDNPGRWSKSALLSLEAQGIFTLERDGSRIMGIEPGSIKKIQRKKILILTDEQVGYRQFRFKPANFAQYMEFAHEEGMLDPSFGFDPRLAKIQKAIYGLLAET